jgi:hypothetical protein
MIHAMLKSMIFLHTMQAGGTDSAGKGDSGHEMQVSGAGSSKGDRVVPVFGVNKTTMLHGQKAFPSLF